MSPQGSGLESGTRRGTLNFPRVEKYRLFRYIGNMRNLLDLKKLGAQGGSRLIFKHARKAVLGYSGSASAQGGVGKFWTPVVDRSALDSILQNHLPLLATHI